jgi:hypothetical protein
MSSQSYCEGFQKSMNPNLMNTWQKADPLLRLAIVMLISLPLYLLPIKILKSKWYRLHWMTVTYWTLTTELLLLFSLIHLFNPTSPLHRLLRLIIPLPSIPPQIQESSAESSSDATTTPTDETAGVQRSPSRSSETLHELYEFILTAPFLVKCMYAASLSHDDKFFPFLWLTSTLVNTFIFVWIFISFSAC